MTAPSTAHPGICAPDLGSSCDDRLGVSGNKRNAGARNDALLPQDLREIFDYDPITGKLFWKKRVSSRTPIGEEAGYRKKSGIDVSIYGREYRTHRIIFAITNGRWPLNLIDHINGDPFDNRIENLREATHSQNQANRPPRPGCGSRFLGVYPRRGKWCARCQCKGIEYSGGYFNCEIAAARAYDQLAQKLHGEFARLNFPSLNEGAQ